MRDAIKNVLDQLFRVDTAANCHTAIDKLVCCLLVCEAARKHTAQEDFIAREDLRLAVRVAIEVRARLGEVNKEAVIFILGIDHGVSHHPESVLVTLAAHAGGNDLG